MYGDTFNDENFEVGISEKGTVAMANKGPNSNGSQFFVTFRSWQFLDNMHVGFGQVVGKESLVSRSVRGGTILREMER